MAAVAGFTGWIGGEVLVYRSGVAVEAAAGGALAPTVAEPSNAQPIHPGGIMDAMGQLRGSWAAVTTDVARMVVDHPRDARFDRIARHAEHMRRLAQWMAENPGSHPADRGRDDTRKSAGGAPQARASARGSTLPLASAMLVATLEGGGPGLAAEASPGATDSAPSANQGDARRLAMVTGAQTLEKKVRAVERAAWDRNLGEVARALGEVSSTCARCHQETRWSRHEPGEQDHGMTGRGQH